MKNDRLLTKRDFIKYPLTFELHLDRKVYILVNGKTFRIK